MRPLSDQPRSNSAAAPSTCNRNRDAGFWRSVSKSLGDIDEPDAVLLQDLNVVQAVDERATKTVQLPYQEAIKFLASASATSRFSAGRLVFTPLLTSS